MNRFSTERVLDNTPRKTSPEVTVAISTRDRPDALRRCLDALLGGTLLPGEIIIVDQSRDEGTRRLVETYEGSTVPIRCIPHQGSGLGVSQNIAAAHVTSPLIAVIDDDCVAAPDWIHVIASMLGSGDALDVLTGRVLPLGPESPGLFGVSLRTSEVRAEFSSDAMPWDIGSGNNFAVRTAWWNRIEGNDERLGPGSSGRGGVDMDLFYRLLRAGTHIRYEPQLIVYHERTTREGRIARRSMYGHGMGAACMIHLRGGDLHALRMLGNWLWLRMSRMGAAMWRRNWLGVYEEGLVLAGTGQGMLYGLEVLDVRNPGRERLRREAQV